MAIFNQKTESTQKEPGKGTLARTDLVLQPRMSEKSSSLEKLNKYVFTVKAEANKVELKKALEKMYNIKIARINMVSLPEKTKRYGQRYYQKAGLKKAVVTLKPGSGKPVIAETT